jgi:2-polyprenyl-3-methyl-5-hydroxy-6-metoxy-1,4-benzoquinol methylase
MVKIFASSEDANSLGNKFRNKRFSFFEKHIQKLPKPIRILDVGGLESFWVNRNYHLRADINITLLNLEALPVKHPNMTAVSGDATNLSDYTNKSFDVVFSNSVIEHLYTKENQIKMANEIRRVGKHYFVQTPNKYFIIEPHYLLPGFQFLGPKSKYFMLTKTPLSRGKFWDKKFAKQYVDEIRLIDEVEMVELFPDGKIHKEVVCGLIKSFTAHNFDQ